MDEISIILGIVHILTAVVIILISIPLVRGKVSMNKVYGIRFKKSYESEENWYRINEYGGKQLILWSIPLLIFGFISFFLPLEGRSHLIVAVSCAPLIVIVPAIQSYIFSKKL